jgi:translation initiation factor 2-alpha kinase 4
VSESTASNSTRDTPASADVQLLLPGDLKKQRRQTKQIFLDRAFDGAARVKAAAVAGLPVLALDVPATLFDALVRSAAWVSDDEAWRPLVGAFPVGQGAYAQQIRDAAARRRAEGHAFLLLSAVRDERVGLLTL